jgi:hypothetical protein
MIVFDKTVEVFKAICLDDILSDMTAEEANVLMQRLDKNVSYGDASWTLVDNKTFKSWLPEGVDIPELNDDILVAIRG